jgi:hypothetical protein
MYILRPETVLGEFDASHIYKHYERMDAELKREFRKYVLIAEPEVDTVMLGELGMFHKYAVESMRCGLSELLETEEYKSIPKDERFEIHSGEYFEPCEVIHSELQNKNDEELIKLLNRREKDAYICGDFTGLHYEEGFLRNRDLRYANFGNANLRGADLSLGLLIGAKFKGCLLEGADLTASNVSDANFEGAKLAGAKLPYIVALQGRNAANEWKTVGFTGTNFRGDRKSVV